MSIHIDGSPEPATYGQALVYLAEHYTEYPNDAVRQEIVRAVQREHGLVPPEATPVYADPRDQTINAQDARLAELERQLADRERADADARTAERVAQLEAQLAERDAYVQPAASDA